jgi:hypothetical protein
MLHTFQDLDFISVGTSRLAHLQELILLGNPVRDQAFYRGQEKRYTEYVL